MKLLVHDLTKDEMERSIQSPDDNLVIVSRQENEPHCCMGCFGCWVKDPGECVIKDGYQHMGEYIGNCEELIIVTDCVYGEFSVFIKSLIDRSISASLPYFTEREGMMHHELRYGNHPKMKVYCYRSDLMEEEKQTFRNRCEAMRINLGACSLELHFVNGKEELGGVAL